MNIALFGAGGMIGQRILLEALVRGHDVIALARNPQTFPITHPRLRVAQVDLRDPVSVAENIADVDVVVNATGDRGVTTAHAFYIESTTAIIEGVRRMGNKRFTAVSLEK